RPDVEGTFLAGGGDGHANVKLLLSDIALHYNGSRASGRSYRGRISQSEHLARLPDNQPHQRTFVSGVNGVRKVYPRGLCHRVIGHSEANLRDPHIEASCIRSTRVGVSRVKGNCHPPAPAVPHDKSVEV